jgi:hypothetical protein
LVLTRSGSDLQPTTLPNHGPRRASPWHPGPAVLQLSACRHSSVRRSSVHWPRHLPSRLHLIPGLEPIPAAATEPKPEPPAAWPQPAYKHGAVADAEGIAGRRLLPRPRVSGSVGRNVWGASGFGLVLLPEVHSLPQAAHQPLPKQQQRQRRFSSRVFTSGSLC